MVPAIKDKKKSYRISDILSFILIVNIFCVIIPCITCNCDLVFRYYIIVWCIMSSMLVITDIYVHKQ